MPESLLWSLDARGHLLKLSTHSSQWQRVESPRSKVRHFSRAACASWCVWAIASDQQCYLMVLSSDLKIRVQEALYENERTTLLGNFGSTKLLNSDPANFCSLRDRRPVRKESIRLPSSRWSWEDSWYVQETSNGELTDKGGWQYANDFNGPFSSERRFLSVVRRRKWIRFRRFSALDRWLYIHSPYEDHTSDPFVNIAVGGELLPHRPDGALLVFSITMQGIVYFRKGVERACPEGTGWHEIDLPPETSVINCSVGPMGHLWLISDDGSILVRQGVTWKNVLGTAWVRLSPPSSLLPHQMLVQASIGVRSAWAVANTGHCWFRQGIDVFLAEDPSLPSDLRLRNLLGYMWVDMTVRVLMLSLAPNDQVWALDMVSRELLYRTGISASSPSGKVWRSVVLAREAKRRSSRAFDVRRFAQLRGKLASTLVQSEQARSVSQSEALIEGEISPIQRSSSWSQLARNSDENDDDEVVVTIDPLTSDEEEVLEEDEDSSFGGVGDGKAQTSLRWCCASALQLAESDLPRLWKVAASEVANGVCRPRVLSNYDVMEQPWRNEIFDLLKARNSGKQNDFSDFTDVIERGTWVKEAGVHFQQLSTTAWLPGRLLLEQWRDGAEVSGVLKMQVTPDDTRPVPSSDVALEPLIQVGHIICVAKLHNSEARIIVGIFVEGKNPPLPVKLISEEEAEDWLSTLTLVCCEHRGFNLNRPRLGRLFLISRLSEVFLSEDEANVSCLSLNQRYWRQVGGHLKAIESGAHGVTWGLGHDGRPWVFTNGYGGGFFTGLVTSMAGINSQTDTAHVYTFEYQRWRFFSGYTDRSSWLGPHMWSDENGKEARPKESFRLLSHSWTWASDWFVDHKVKGGCDVDGWQYSTDYRGPYNSSNGWRTGFRRRKWMRAYRAVTSGPWEELNSVSLMDLSIQSAPAPEDRVELWALAATNGEVLRRKNVSKGNPAGTSWEHIEAETPFQSISISPCLRVWAIDCHGSAWMRTGVSRDNPRGIAWQLVDGVHGPMTFSSVSCGGDNEVYARNVTDELWRRVGVSPSRPEGVHWSLVSHGVSHVSCGPGGMMLSVMRTSGSVVERKGMGEDALGGRCWNPVLKRLCSHITTRGFTFREARTY